ncbi:MAG: CgeB family protein [Sulfuricaulis sp.]
MRASPKILVVSSFTEIATANYFVRAFREAGHSLLVYSDVRNAQADVVGPGVVDVARLAARKGFEPDLLLFIEGGTMQVFPIGLEKLACRTAWYGIDTHMDYGKHLRIGRLFDVTFVAQKQYVARLRADGLHQVYWLPLAFAPEIAPEAALPRQYELAYVGSDDPRMHPERHALLTAIRHKLDPVFIGRADPREMMRIYAQAKMVFNKSVNNDINMRYFEAMGAGAVLLTDPIRDNGVEELFDPKHHFVQYQDEASLLRAIEMLRQDPARGQEIGAAARGHVLSQHTYAHRAKALLVTVESCKKGATTTADSYIAALAALSIPEGVLWAVRDLLAQMGGGCVQRLTLKFLGAGIAGLAVAAGLLARFRLRMSSHG